MADVSKLRLGNTSYNIKDADARRYLVVVNDDPENATKVVINSGSTEIELAEQEDLDAVAEKVDWYVTPEMFGAAGDGVTDDSNAFSDMITAARGSSKTVIISNNTYKLTSAVSFRNLSDIRCDGVLDGNITIGASSTIGEPINISIQKCTGTVTVVGMKNASVTVQKAYKLLIDADGSDASINSCAYNKFHLGTIDTIQLYAHGQGAWITENVFNCSRTIDIDISTDANATTLNNNRFYSACLEGGSVSIAGKSRLNYIECRAEGTFDVTFDSDVNCRDNTIVREYRVNEIYDVKGYGNNNIVIYSYMPGMTTIPIYTMRKDLLGDITNNRIYPTATGFHLNTFAPIYDTGKLLIPDGLLRLTFDCDIQGLGFQLTLYDSNGTLITTNNSEVGGLGVNFNSNNGIYALSAQTYTTHTLTIKKNTAKFFQYKLLNGNTAKDVKYVSLKADVMTTAPIVFPPQLETVSNTTPTGDGWATGDFVRCITSNTIHGWLKYGSWIETYYNPFKIKTVTGTPNQYGALALDLTSVYIICVSSPTTSNVVCTPYKSGTSWYVQCKNLSNGNAITSSIDVQVIYTTLAATG